MWILAPKDTEIHRPGSVYQLVLSPQGHSECLILLLLILVYVSLSAPLRITLLPPEEFAQLCVHPRILLTIPRISACLPASITHLQI